MAKKSMIARQIKRQKLELKYQKRRQHLKVLIKNTKFLDEKLTLYGKLQRFPLNSSPVRLKNRCMITGRPKAYYGDFGISRQVLREMGHQCLLPGLKKSSW